MALFPQHRPLSSHEARAAEALKSAVGEFAFLRVTPTGLRKGIIDANRGVREYLVATGFHDYADQERGDDGRLLRPAVLVDATGRRESVVSLYRPQTKKGDPRIWIQGLAELAAPFDLLALVVADDELRVTNLTAVELADPRPVPTAEPSALRLPLEVATPRAGNLPATVLDILARDPLDEPNVAEALRRLRLIATMGWIDGDGHGDTAVGRTLETALGIPMNAKQAPDLLGCELKAFRKPTNRVSLFSKTPDWSRSALTSSRAIVEAHGQAREGEMRIRHSLKAVERYGYNSYGLGLRVSADDSTLAVIHRDDPALEIAVWDIAVLQAKLAAKHRTTFWLRAETRQGPRGEQFRYVSARLTQNPKVELLPTLLREGVIELDLRLTIRIVKKGGGDSYLFKLGPANFDLLFPVREISLLEVD